VSDKGGDAPERDALIHQARAAGVAIQSANRERLDDLSAGATHQSFVAELRPLPDLSIGQLIDSAADAPRSVLLFLDAINDPHNLGAALRAAECFGVAGVVWSRNRGTSLTPTARKVSVGASELVPQAVIANLADGVRKAKDAGYWIVTAEVGDDCVSLPKFDPPDRIALVLGSEGDGVQPLIRKLADIKVQIPMRGAIDSLNVSQATAVLLYAVSNQIRERSAA
jgi:23S rRNA (guanosine2251-2'-O)-methyltransferase